MSAVDEGIVREFFELHGFLVCQRRKYIVQTRQKTADEEVDLIVLNPTVPSGRPRRNLRFHRKRCQRCHGQSLR